MGETPVDELHARLDRRTSVIKWERSIEHAKVSAEKFRAILESEWLSLRGAEAAFDRMHSWHGFSSFLLNFRRFRAFYEVQFKSDIWPKFAPGARPRLDDADLRADDDEPYSRRAETHEIEYAVAMRAMSAVYLWSIFEAAAADVLRYALDACPDRARTMWAVARDDQTNKLRKHERKILKEDEKPGAVLASILDFSGVTDVVRNFRIFFPEAAALECVVDDEALRDLAALRNVAVHRAMQVDEDFTKRFRRYVQSDAIYDVTFEDLAESAQAIVRSTLRLVAVVDSWKDAPRFAPPGEASE